MGQTQNQENSDAYTVVIFRGSTAKPLRFSFPRKFVRKLLIVGCILIVADLLVVSHYVIRTGEVWELSAFRSEAMSAREQTAAFSSAVDDLKKRIGAMKEVNQRLRVMLGIEVPKSGDMANGRGGEETPLPEGSLVPGSINGKGSDEAASLSGTNGAMSAVGVGQTATPVVGEKDTEAAVSSVKDGLEWLSKEATS